MPFQPDQYDSTRSHLYILQPCFQHPTRNCSCFCFHESSPHPARAPSSLPLLRHLNYIHLNRPPQSFGIPNLAPPNGRVSKLDGVLPTGMRWILPRKNRASLLLWSWYLETIQHQGGRETRIKQVRVNRLRKGDGRANPGCGCRTGRFRDSNIHLPS